MEFISFHLRPNQIYAKLSMEQDLKYKVT